MADNHRHTRRELGRHFEATAKVMHDSQFVSTSGPDGSKIGTDFAVQNTVLMDGYSGRVAWAAPQVNDGGSHPVVTYCEGVCVCV